MVIADRVCVTFIGMGTCDNVCDCDAWEGEDICDCDGPGAKPAVPAFAKLYAMPPARKEAMAPPMSNDEGGAFCIDHWAEVSIIGAISTVLAVSLMTKVFLSPLILGRDAKRYGHMNRFSAGLKDLIWTGICSFVIIHGVYLVWSTLMDSFGVHGSPWNAISLSASACPFSLVSVWLALWICTWFGHVRLWASSSEFCKRPEAVVEDESPAARGLLCETPRTMSFIN